MPPDGVAGLNRDLRAVIGAASDCLCRDPQRFCGRLPLLLAAGGLALRPRGELQVEVLEAEVSKQIQYEPQQ